MALSVEIIKMAQSILNEKGLKAGDVDGLAGTKTANALNKVPELKTSWSTDRKIIGLIQLYAKGRGIDPGDIDGLWGVRTADAYEQLKHQLLFGHPEEPWRPEETPLIGNPNNWPVQSEAAMNAFFGTASPNGNNLVSLDLPYGMVLAWDPGTAINRIKCNAKVKDSLQRIFTNVLDQYGIEQIKDLKLHYFGGCFNFRKMRGGTKLSTHSWGIALDFDPDNNQLKWGRDRATFAKPDYINWWETWEKEGWVSLGRQRNFDWMHVQAAKLTS